MDIQKDNIDDRLKKIIIKNLKFKVPDNEIDETLNIIKAFGLDSLQLVKIIDGIEMEFDIRFSDLSIVNDAFSSYGSLKEYILNNMSD
jgi:acyl carrier protein